MEKLARVEGGDEWGTWIEVCGLAIGHKEMSFSEQQAICEKINLAHEKAVQEKLEEAAKIIDPVWAWKREPDLKESFTTNDMRNYHEACAKKIRALGGAK